MKILTQKEQIADTFKKLKKYGYKVKNRSHYKAMPKGMIGETDLFGVGNGCLFFFEVKIGKDTLTPEQIELAKSLIEVSKVNPLVFYAVITEKDYTEYSDLLIGRRFQLLKDYCVISWQKNKLTNP